jgi:MoaA/NifB/PqqE/SkfB family radical SAM enzyme
MINQYRRVAFDSIPIYIQPETPDWFIPTAKGDFILRSLKKGGSIPTIAQKFNQKFGGEFFYALLLINNLLSRLDNHRPAKYRGRRYYRHLQNLKECWLHVTNQCTMTCKHCMFSSNPKKHTYLHFEKLLQTITEAYRLGCKVFFFTGGEPFLYVRLTEACDAILNNHDTRVVILTNGKDVRKFEGWLKKKSTDRLHFQISMDGLEKNHDAIRGRGAFHALLRTLRFLKNFGFPITLAMTVTRHNVQEMASVVTIAGELGISNIHYLWFFKKGKGNSRFFVPPFTIFPELRKAHETARNQNIIIDNVESIKSQIFSLPGTKFDLSNAAWESIALGPDEIIYPSPALIGEKELAAGTIGEGLKNVWEKSPVFKKLRASSLIQDKTQERNPLKYLIGGGDIDHSYIAGKTFVGADPYGELYNLTALYLLSQAAEGFEQNDNVGLVCRMGEHLLACDENSAPIAFTHSNCFLSIPKKNAHDGVTAFYSRATESVNSDILNPVPYPEEEISHIPK